MKRIGEILVEQGWVTPAALERALAKQSGEGVQRICSILISRDVIDVDVAARALGEQHGVPAVLQKHIDHRDRSLAQLIPAELARTWCVLPIGRRGNGELIVCARDPQPNVLAAVAAVVDGPILLAVAPASLLETLVTDTYGNAEEDFDVDLTTGPIHSLDLEPTPMNDPTNDPLAALGNLELVELDDQGVSRDPDQSAVIQIGPQERMVLPQSSAAIKLPTLPPPNVPRQEESDGIPKPSRTMTPVRSPLPPKVPPAPPPSIPRTTAKPITVPPPIAAAKPVTTPPPVATAAVQKTRVDRDVIAAAYAVAPPKFDPSQIAVGTEPPRRRSILPQDPVSLTDTFASLSSAPSRDAITAAAMRYAAGRWRAALLLAVKGKSAAGEAGHGQLLGEDVVAGLSIPVTVPSLVSLALDTGLLTTEPPAGDSPVQDRLDRLLGMPRFPAAIAISVAGRLTYVLVTGDPIADDADSAMADLELLADALGAAYARFLR